MTSHDDLEARLAQLDSAGKLRFYERLRTHLSFARRLAWEDNDAPGTTRMTRLKVFDGLLDHVDRATATLKSAPDSPADSALATELQRGMAINEALGRELAWMIQRGLESTSGPKTTDN